MKTFNEKRKKFKKMMYGQQLVNMVVVPDSLAAKIAEQNGFQALFVAGYAASADLLGLPDRGVLDFDQQLEQLNRICQAVDIPVFADADTGYGDLENVRRTVESFEQAGAVGLFLEDQSWPKRCGHMLGKQLVSTEDLAAKIKVAVDARHNNNFLIMSRTDARQTYGLGEAIKRSHQYRKAGADMVFIEAPQSKDELQQIVTEFPDVPLMANMIEGGATPLTSADDLSKMGYRILVHPTDLTYVNAYADRMLLHELQSTGKTTKSQSQMIQFSEFNKMVGLDYLNDLDKKYSNTAMQQLLK
ncbi:Isocitrate lyase [Lactiplantibacillus plantarum]|uniref:isocitrate lyase/PEP mutase family protein n=1 Tax=Lactiplantibacillus plantarum TaxID=1590 RepID=UPI0007B55746|nr:isocitrate lyase/PEP mutase family protein [Lactiplantibacillus plantarum]KZU34517.1 Isocitrate lyase [Lactiplantibacillus plantarum]KZU75112.1 Isocitrate lyase [Lactiplantibacillus plantarum]